MTAADSRSEPVVRSPRALVGQAAVFAFVAVVTRLPGLVDRDPFNTDEATLALGGRALRSGGALYVDLVDRKPPLPFALYALFGTGDLRWMRLVVVVLVVLSALLVADEAARRWGGRAGWVGGSTVVVAAAALAPNDAQAANFELFALLPIVVAIVAAARRRPAVAGVALAFAVLSKQPAAVTAVPVLWSCWRAGRARAVAWCVAAGAVATVALAAPFGIGDVLHWALLGTGGYLAFGAAELGTAAVRALALVAIAGGFWSGAVLLVAAAGRRFPGVASVDRPEFDAPVGRRWWAGPDADVWLLAAVSVVALVPGFRFFPHYLIQLLPAFGLLAAKGAVRRPGVLRPAVVLGVAATIVAGVLAWGTVGERPPAYETGVAAYVQAHSDDHDRILVWGNAPEILWRAHRLPAGGYPHSEFFTGYSGGRVHTQSTEANTPDPVLYRDWVADLRADPPALVVDTAAADIRGGRWFRLADFPELADFVARHYHRVATIDGVPVYARNGS